MPPAGGGYVEELGIDMCTEGGDYIARVSADTYREAGAWPSPGTAADRRLAAPQAQVDRAAEGEAKTRARRMLDAFTAAGRDVAVDVASSVVTGQITNEEPSCSLDDVIARLWIGDELDAGVVELLDVARHACLPLGELELRPDVPLAVSPRPVPLQRVPLLKADAIGVSHDPKHAPEV